LLAGVGVVAAYYFKILQPKKENKNTPYDSSLYESGDSESANGLGDGFDYDEDDIPYDRDDDPNI
jgi:hypothetical protein